MALLLALLIPSTMIMAAVPLSNPNHYTASAEPGICASSVSVHGYECQEYEVQTEDGFILSLQRIPDGRHNGRSGDGTTKQPVLIQHGVLVDGMTWFLNRPEQNLPFILAENGFDVWIANTRGTKFCRKHKHLDPSTDEFWNWTWDELVRYDLPAVSSFIRNQTALKMDYLGHSMGTLIALASLSEGMFVDNVRSAALLSPIAYLNHMTTVLGVAAAKSFVGEIGSTFFGLAEFYPKGYYKILLIRPFLNSFFHELLNSSTRRALTEFFFTRVEVDIFLQILCSRPGANCYDLMTAITGPNCCINASTIQLFLQNEPQSTSTKNLVHLSQTVRDGVLAKYDFGNPAYNLMHYGSLRPPVYNLTNIPRNFPLFLSYGGMDALSDVHDVQLLLDDLKFHDVDKDYGHADFIMGVSAKDIVYSAVVSFFKRQITSP